MFHLFDVSDIPDVDGVVVVYDGNLEVLLVVGDGGGVGVAGVAGVGGHVTDGQTLGHVNTEKMSKVSIQSSLPTVCLD